MKVLLAGIHEPLMSTINHYIEAFRAEGHELVTCGAIQGLTSGNLTDPNAPDYIYKNTTWDEQRARKYRYDLPVHDRPYPNYYSYKEILDRCPWKPDLIVQVEPHFFFQGTRQDRHRIPVAYLTFDNHRGPLTHLEAFRKGEIDQIFINSLHFMRPYTDALGADRVTWLPVAANPRLHHPRPDVQEQCDIAFAGNPGWMNSGRPYEEWLMKTGVRSQEPHNDMRFWLWHDESDEIEWQKQIDFCESGDNIALRLGQSAPWERFNNWEHREYVERGEYLYRLFRDFKVRLYSAAVHRNYNRVMNRGRIGFNCSLRNDINMKLFEYAAAGKMIVTDYVAGLDQLMPAATGWIYYTKYYQGDNINFNLDYNEVKNIMQLYLQHPDERALVARRGYEHVLKHHTYQHRVRKIVETMFK